MSSLNQTAAGKILVRQIERVRENLQNAGEVRPTIQVIEVGYRAGEDLFPLTKITHADLRYIGFESDIDNCLAVSDKLEEIRKNKTFIVAPSHFSMIPLQSNLFNIFYSYNFFDTLKTDSERDRFLSKAVSVLKPGGEMIVGVGVKPDTSKSDPADWDVNAIFNLMGRHNLKVEETLSPEGVKKHLPSEETSYRIYRATKEPS